MLWLYTIILFVTLVVLSEALRRLPLIVGIALWAVAPIVVFPLWLDFSQIWDWTWFAWVKSYSIIMACLIIFIARATRWLSDSVCGWLWYLLLATNILEAVILDIISARYLSAVLGIALMIMLPSRHHASIEYQNKYRDVAYALPLSWILAYTLWNFALIYANWEGRFAAHHLAVLSAPLFIAWLTGWRYWLQARAVTLGIYLIALNSNYTWFRQVFNSSSWYHESIPVIITSAGFLFLIVPKARHHFQHKKKATR